MGKLSTGLSKIGLSRIWPGIVVLFLSACSDGGGGPYGVNGCSIPEQNEIVHRALLDRYYWYQTIPEQVSYTSFDSPSQTLASLRYDTLDRFSSIASQSEFENLFDNGTFIGYGFGFGIDDTNRAFIRYVFNGSPAHNQSIVRGDEILEINGQSVASIIASNSWNTIFGASQVGVVLSLRLLRKAGGEQLLSLAKQVVTINTVLHSEVIDSGVNKIGYLVFNSFLNTSVDEFVPVFASFKAAGVNRLILDLRYNGGGSIDVARELASHIKSTFSFNSDLYVKLVYNDKHQSDNFSFFFRPEVQTLGLNQIAVITTESTCSASEQVISALRPYFGQAQVTTVGATSCGKPVGMNPLNFCALTLLAVNFAGLNANNQGDYFSGIPADCAASDDVGFAFGDAAEPMLQAAKYHVDNGICQPIVSRSSGASRRNVLQGFQAVIGAV